MYALAFTACTVSVSMLKSHFCCDYRVYCTSLQPDWRKSHSATKPLIPLSIKLDLNRLSRYDMCIPEPKPGNQTGQGISDDTTMRNHNYGRYPSLINVH